MAKTSTAEAAPPQEAAGPSQRALDADDLRAVSTVFGIPVQELQLMLAQDNATRAWQRTQKGR
jgi:hypothetical protein